MTSVSPTSTLEVDLQAGRPPALHVDVDDAPAWASSHRRALRELVAVHGSVLVRGLGLRDHAQTAATFGALAGSLMTEREAFAPRRSYGDGVYSSATWPPNQPMCMHHELSYRVQVPGLLLFACLQAPTSGGATAVADATAVLDALPEGLVDRFEREGWLLTRTYNEDVGASVLDAFGTSERDEVERYCRANDIETAWGADGELRTRQRRRAVVEHPTTGRRCWFNQVAFLSEWTLDPEVREFLVDMYGADGLPFNTHFGNGDPISKDVVDLLNETYTRLTVREPWQAGDLLLVDNVGAAHSREAFEGPREVLVAMAEPLVNGGPTVQEGSVR